MSIATTKCLLLCILLSLVTSIGVNASVSIDTPSIKSPTKEIIIISFADMNGDDIASLVNYIESLYQGATNAKVTIKNYGKTEMLNPGAQLSIIVKNIDDSKISSDDIEVIQESEVIAAPYFTITVDQKNKVQF